MKTRTTWTIAGAMALATGLAVTTLADIEGSAHDFSNSTWAGGEICKPCHAPHGGNTDVGFLWSRPLSTQVYTLYDDSTTSPGGVDELDQPSRLCLSCHDGTIALNDFHNGGGGTPVFISPDRNIALNGDLSDDHPIGVTAEYPIFGNGGYNAPTESPSGFWGFGGGFFPDVPLFPFKGEQVVSCSSCHTPHAVAGVDHLLRISNAGSDLCLTCHIK